MVARLTKEIAGIAIAGIGGAIGGGALGNFLNRTVLIPQHYPNLLQLSPSFDLPVLHHAELTGAGLAVGFLGLVGGALLGGYLGSRGELESTDGGH